MSIATLINCGLWIAYGFAIKSLYVWLPNTAGILVSLLQMVLLLRFRQVRRMPEGHESWPACLCACLVVCAVSLASPGVSLICLCGCCCACSPTRYLLWMWSARLPARKLPWQVSRPAAAAAAAACVGCLLPLGCGPVLRFICLCSHLSVFSLCARSLSFPSLLLFLSSPSPPCLSQRRTCPCQVWWCWWRVMCGERRW